MVETKRADEVVPGDVVAFGRMTRCVVVDQPEVDRGRVLDDGIVVIYLQTSDERITPFELAAHAEAEKLADGSWWF